jgi:outer membrane protein
MKKIIAILSIVFFSSSVFAQKYAYVDTKYILENIPEYTKNQKQLDDISAGWQKEIEGKYKEIDEMYKNFQAEQVLLSDDMKKKREQEIMDKEKKVKDLQKQRFGYEGDLFKKRQDLIKPIQDKIYDAIQKMAQAKNWDFVFDKSAGGSALLYTNPTLDKSNEILKEMGYKPGAAKENKDPK